MLTLDQLKSLFPDSTAFSAIAAVAITMDVAQRSRIERQWAALKKAMVEASAQSELLRLSPKERQRRGVSGNQDVMRANRIDRELQNIKTRMRALQLEWRKQGFAVS